MAATVHRPPMFMLSNAYSKVKVWHRKRAIRVAFRTLRPNERKVFERVLEFYGLRHGGFL